MLEQITKEQFLDAVCDHETQWMFSHMNSDAYLLDEYIRNGYMDDLLEYSEYVVTNTVVDVCFGAIQFSNGYWLYFNDNQEYFKYKNIVVAVTTQWDEIDKIMRYSLEAYTIV